MFTGILWIKMPPADSAALALPSLVAGWQLPWHEYGSHVHRGVMLSDRAKTQTFIGFSNGDATN